MEYTINEIREARAELQQILNTNVRTFENKYPGVKIEKINFRSSATQSLGNGETTKMFSPYIEIILTIL